MKAQWIVTIATTLASGLLVNASYAQNQPYPANKPNQPGSPNQSGQLNHKDFKFLTNAARGGMEEVQLGQLALQKTSHPFVRSFADLVVAEHNKANDELRQLAVQKGVNLQAKMFYPEECSCKYIEKLSGADFDQAYAKDMVTDHRKDVKEFESALKNLADPDLRAWAQKTLPVLQQHLQLAENLETNVKGNK